MSADLRRTGTGSGNAAQQRAWSERYDGGQKATRRVSFAVLIGHLTRTKSVLLACFISPLEKRYLSHLFGDLLPFKHITHQGTVRSLASVKVTFTAVQYSTVLYSTLLVEYMPWLSSSGKSISIG